MRKACLLGFLISTLMVGVILDLSPIHVPNGVDKICHFIGFFLLTAIATLHYIENFGSKHINSFLLFLMTFGSLIAGISETLQKYVSVRDCDVADWAVNLLGITLVCIITYLIFAKEAKEKEISYATFSVEELSIRS